jgi:transcriptional regulator with XRE-family HTH domain
MDLKEIGNMIKERREFLNLRQEDLSEIGNMTNRTIHLIENGTGNPSFKTLKKIAEVLGLEINLTIKQVN